MTANELREKTDAELQQTLLDLTKETFNLRMQAGTGQLSRYSQVKSARRDIARIKTVLSERSRG